MCLFVMVKAEFFLRSALYMVDLVYGTNLLIQALGTSIFPAGFCSRRSREHFQL